MPKTVEARIASLEADSAAYRDALIAIVAVLDRHDRGLGRRIVVQAQALANEGPAQNAPAMTRLLDELRVALDAPVND